MARDELDAAERSCERHNRKPDALIEILHDVQHACGCVSDDAVRVIAQELNLSRAEVHGVRSYYSDFSDTPRAAKLKLCRAEACQSVGSEALAAELERRGIATETVYCLGNCALGPAAMIADRLIGRADADRLAAELEEADHG